MRYDNTLCEMLNGSNLEFSYPCVMCDLVVIRRFRHPKLLFTST